MGYLKKGPRFDLNFHENQLTSSYVWLIYAWFCLLIFFLSMHAPTTCEVLVEVGKSRIKLLSNNFRLNLFLSQNLVLQHTHILCSALDMSIAFSFLWQKYFLLTLSKEMKIKIPYPFLSRYLPVTMHAYYVLCST